MAEDLRQKDIQAAISNETSADKAWNFSWQINCHSLKTVSAAATEIGLFTPSTGSLFLGERQGGAQSAQLSGHLQAIQQRRLLLLQAKKGLDKVGDGGRDGGNRHSQHQH